MFVSRPPTPRYSFTWDVSQLTSYLAAQPPVQSLTLKALTLRTVTLCSLVSAQREQTLSSLDFDNVSIYDDEINFVIGKTSRPGKKPLEVSIPSLPTNLSLCPKQTLLHYNHCTQDLSKSGEQTESQLFIPHVKPHKPVFSSTLGTWIKTVMTDSGIGTSIFKPRSVRGASTSALYQRGASLVKIMKMADWSSERTLNRFYNRNVNNTNPSSLAGRLVLS